MNEKDISKKFSSRRVLFPVIFGLGVATWLLIHALNSVTYTVSPDHTGNYYRPFNPADTIIDLHDDAGFKPLSEAAGVLPEITYNRITALEELGKVSWTWSTTFWMLIALLMVAIRDLGYMYRIRVLTDKKLTWRQAFDVIMLWEFASSITPSVVGGSGVALFILNRENIPMGKSTAVVMVTAMLDELFYILMVPLVLVVVGTESLFLAGNYIFMDLELNTAAIFWMGYGFLVLLTLIILLAVFIYPQGFRALLSAIFKLKFLKRWRNTALNTGDGIVLTSKELKGKNAFFWLKALGATFFSWTARFWVVNFMILAFTSNSLVDNMMIYAKQLVMWVIMLISPTPGGVGIAEVAFSEFLVDFMPVGIPVIVMGILWRFFSYYPYLFIGAFILPRWLRKTAKNKAERKLATARGSL